MLWITIGAIAICVLAALVVVHIIRDMWRSDYYK